MPGGIPTILPVDPPLRYSIRAEFLPEVRCGLAWRALEVGAEDADSTPKMRNGR